MQKLIPALQSLEASGDLQRPQDPKSFTQWTEPDESARTVTVVEFIEDDRAMRRPGMTNCLNDRLVLRPPNLNVLKARFAVADHECLDRLTVQVQTMALSSFAGAPLTVLGIEDYVREIPLRAEGEPAVKLVVPFDVSEHPDAKTAAAKRIAERMETDMVNYESQVNEATGYVFTKDLLSDDIDLKDKIGLIERLENATCATRDADHEFVQNSFECIRSVANMVPRNGTPGATPSSLNAAVQFQLERCVFECPLTVGIGRIDFSAVGMLVLKPGFL